MKNVFILRLVFLSLATFFVGCITPYYDLKIYEVEKPIQIKERYGKTNIIQLNDTYEYEDENIKILWKEAHYSLPFELTNKSEFSIKILWDDVVFVDVDGISRRVIDSDIFPLVVNKLNVYKPQIPSVISKKTKIRKSLIPADNIVYGYDSILGRYSYNKLEPFLPGGLFGRDLKNLVGKTVQILLPIEIKGVVNEYLFGLKVHNAGIK